MPESSVRGRGDHAKVISIYVTCISKIAYVEPNLFSNRGGNHNFGYLGVVLFEIQKGREEVWGNSILQLLRCIEVRCLGPEQDEKMPLVDHALKSLDVIKLL